MPLKMKVKEKESFQIGSSVLTIKSINEKTIHIEITGNTDTKIRFPDKETNKGEICQARL